MNKNVQIFSIEGKDLLTKNYCLTKNSLRKGSLDDSMETDKLRTLGKTIIKLDKKKERYYTDEVITVTFKYACKGDRDLTDEEYERVQSLKKTYSLVRDKEIKKEIKEQIKIAERRISKKEIREQLYEYGFNLTIDGKTRHYVRYKRTSGSARVGKCLFISDRLFKDMIDWSFAGIEHKEGTVMDCAGVEAYISLPTSSAIDRFKLKPENILLIDDCYSTFEDTVMATKFTNEEYDSNGNIIGGDLYTDIDTTKIKNNLFDGESLLDKSIFEEYGYRDKATLQLRNRFFKGIGVNTDIQRFFRDNNITEISQLNGKTIATDIKQIKLITTPSSVKYLKFGTFEEWLGYVEENWAICKYEKPQHHFNGMAQAHYQLLNTLGMSYKEMEEFLQDTINYINLLKTDIAVFKYHLGINADIEEEFEQKTELPQYIETSNDFILSMLEINEDFEFTKMCKNYRKDNIKSYIKNCRKGHILIEGNYSIMVSCPYEYLLASIGKYKEGMSLLKPFECISAKFDKGERLLGVRSPEPTMANVVMLNNTRNEIMEKYFNTTSKEVIYLSPVNNNIMEQLSSCDWDGDAILITNNKYLVKAGNRLNEEVKIDGKKIKRFLISTDFTPKSSIKRRYTPLDLADVDIKCSANKIGEIINMAQMLNSLYWDKKKKGCDEKELLDLYKDISNLNILSCIEIDRAKKISPVDAKKELDKIRAKHTLGTGFIKIDGEKKEVKVRPMFFKYLDGGKNYKFKRFETGMDYLNKILDVNIKRKARWEKKEVSLDKILLKRKPTKASRKTIMKLKNIAKNMKNELNYIWYNNYENKYELYKETKEKYYNMANKIEISAEIIYEIIKRISKSTDDLKYEEYRKSGKIMLNMLFDIRKKEFLENIEIKPKTNSYLFLDENGKILLYGIKLTKKN